MNRSHLAAPALLACALSVAAAAPLKVYILAGQSNMQGHAHVRTMDVIGLDPATAPMLEEMRNGDGSPRVLDEVWISSIGSSEEEKTGKLTVGFGPSQRGPKIGPEFTFGIYMQKHVGEPILIIKTAWGGKSIHTDFRPPGAGPFVFREEQLEKFKEQGKDLGKVQADKAAATGHYYRLMIDHVKEVLADPKRVYPDYNASDGFELAGFVWFQGWNDMVDRGIYPDRDKPGGYDEYSEVLAHFIRDVRRELSAPKLPFVIGVMGVGGPVEKYTPERQRYAPVHRGFRKAMAAPAALPEFKGNVVAVWTENSWDMELDSLRQKDRQIQKEAKDLVQKGELAREKERETVDKSRRELFSEREREILENGASNAEFHYLGSAKILGQIGKSFADALAGLGD
jgi:alpha-galactosidase